MDRILQNPSTCLLDQFTFSMALGYAMKLKTTSGNGLTINQPRNIKAKNVNRLNYVSPLINFPVPRQWRVAYDWNLTIPSIPG